MTEASQQNVYAEARKAKLAVVLRIITGAKGAKILASRQLGFKKSCLCPFIKDKTEYSCKIAKSEYKCQGTFKKPSPGSIK